MCLIYVCMNKFRRVILTSRYYTHMVQNIHQRTHLPPFLWELWVLFRATGVNFLKFLRDNGTRLYFCHGDSSTGKKSWTGYPREPPDCTIICASVCTLVYSVMEFESEEDNVFWASHWEFCISIVFADAGFSPCSNILCAVVAIGAIMGPGGFCW